MGTAASTKAEGKVEPVPVEATAERAKDAPKDIPEDAADDEHDDEEEHGGDACGCGHDHSACNCAVATKNIILRLLPRLEAEQKAELEGWTMNAETWECVPSKDMVSHDLVEAVYASYQCGAAADSADAEACNAKTTAVVNAYLTKVIDPCIEPYGRAFDDAFLSAIPAGESVASAIAKNEKTMRAILPVFHKGAWAGIFYDVQAKHFAVFDPCNVYAGEEDALKDRLDADKTAVGVYFMAPNKAIAPRYSCVAVCAGLEALVRAGYAPIARRVFARIAEIVGARGDLDDLIAQITEESMHAGEGDDKVDEVVADMGALKVDDGAAGPEIAKVFADRIAYAFATGAPVTPPRCCPGHGPGGHEHDHDHGEGDDDDDEEFTDAEDETKTEAKEVKEVKEEVKVEVADAAKTEKADSADQSKAPAS